jgi:hypothetical protein
MNGAVVRCTLKCIPAVGVPAKLKTTLFIAVAKVPFKTR